MNARQIDHVLSGLTVQQRDVIALSLESALHVDPGPPGTVAETWGEEMDAVRTVRQRQPEPLRSMMRPGHFFAELQIDHWLDPGEGTGYSGLQVTLRSDPYLTDHVEIVDGDWPSPCVPYAAGLGGADGGRGLGGCEGTEALEVVISQDAASKLGWEVGERRGTLILSGIYVPNDRTETYWQHATNGAALGRYFDETGTRALLSAYLNPANPGTDGNPNGVYQLRFVYPLAGGNGGDDLALANSQLQGLLSDPVQFRAPPASPGPDAEPALQVFLTSEVPQVLQRLMDQQRGSTAILAVLAVGPLGVVVAVFALAARLIVTRRRTATSLALARGASPTQLRGLLFVEGLMLGLPAAWLGYLAASVAPLAATGRWEILVALSLGVTPAIVMALSVSTRTSREGRADLGSRMPRWRAVVDSAVVSLTAVAVWRLLDRGLTGTVTASGRDGAAPEAIADQRQPANAAELAVDPLLAATPLLVALAAALLTLRLYPLPVRILLKLLRGRRGLTGFLGAARAVRDPARGVLPALGMILGISVAVFSAVITSTVTRGAEVAAWEATGADIRVSGPRTTDEVSESLRSIDGVSAVARLTTSSQGANLSGPVPETRVSVVVADPGIAAVQEATGVLDPLPPLASRDGKPAVVTGGELPSDATGAATVSGVGDVTVVGHIETLPGFSPGRQFVVISTQDWEQQGRNYPTGNVAFLAVDSEDRRDEVASALRRAVPNALVETPQQELDAYRSAPVTQGLITMALVSAVLATMLTVLAIILVQLIGNPARARLLAVLRTLGSGARQGRRLATWELGPLVTAALMVGCLVGAVVPWLLTEAIDLRAMTGGARQPALSVDPGLMVLVLGSILLVVSSAVALAGALASRTELAKQLRIGDER